MSDTLVKQMRARRDDLREQRAAVSREMRTTLAAVEARGGSSARLTAQESRNFDRLEQRGRDLSRDLTAAELRLDELVDQSARQDRSAAANLLLGDFGEQRSGPSGWSVGAEERTYRPTDQGGHSFFRDLVSARRGDYRAAERLARNNEERASESRALGNTGATGGSGGEMAPPAWLVDEFVALARAGRVTADRLTKQPLPAGVSTINIPKVLSGSATAVQSTQNTAVANVDPTTGALSSGITTVAGKVYVSQQLLDQSPIAFDRMILGDLAADYARALDLQVISGTGTGGQLLGLLTVGGTQQITYDQAAPSVTGAGGFYATANRAVSAVSTARFLPPTAILMHPRRWSWLAAAFDSTGRPLVSPSGDAFNQIADAAAVAAQGPVGQMAGLPVFTDPNLPTNLGAASKQDPVLVLRAEDAYLWESDVVAASFEQPGADSLSVLFRVHGYSAMIAGRYPRSIAVINGTGLVTPVY